MSSEPVSIIETETITSAARLMKEHDIGDVIVLDDTSARLKGIVTDRDIVIRVIAEERDPEQATIGSIASEELVTLSPDDTVDDAVQVMRRRAIRRVPVVDDGHAVGVLSIGDLAERFDQRLALADISSAPPNT